MRTFFLCLTAVAAHAATTVYQASVDQLTVVHGAAAADSAIHHAAPKSLRVEPGGQYPDALVRSAPVSLTIGKRYELSAWVRTENVTVRDTDRSPIATGAALSMASMPFDVHSETIAGTRPWTRLSLKFTATRAQDGILLAVANGGAFKGKAWFEGVSLDEASTTDAWPAREAVRTFGPAWRYPAAGWIYLHIEGNPTSAATSMAISWRAKFPSIWNAAPPISALTAPDGTDYAPRPVRSFSAASIAKSWRKCAASPMARATPASSGKAAASTSSISSSLTSPSNSANCAAP